MNYQFEETRMQSVAIPTRVVDGLLGIATGTQLKVLLFLMRFDKMAHSEEKIAEFCNIAPEDVASAISFWVKERILVQEQGKLRLVSAIKTIQTRELPRVQPTLILEETTVEFRQMVDEIQRLTGKALNSLMISLFYNMAENLGFSPEVIVQLAAYCNSIDKFTYRYMETVAADWYDNGIDSFEKTEEKIRLLERGRKLENRLATAFGIRTAFSKKQREMIETWNEMGMSEEMIREAYDRCMDRKSQMSFSYMNKILEDWHQKGFKKPADILEQSQEHTGRKEHHGLSELEKMMIGKMQAGGENE